MAHSEDWFRYDSIATARMLSLIDEERSGSIKWLYTIRAIDEVFNYFKYSIDQKKKLMTRLKIGFAKEFNADKILRKQLNAKYQKYKSAIFDVLDTTKDEESKMLPLFKILKEQKINAAECVRAILRDREKSLDDLVISYIHMLINRMFRKDQRKCELIIYDFMSRYYTTTAILLEKQQIKNKSSYELSKL